MKATNELHHDKQEAQIEAWKAELKKLKAKAAEATADAKLELQRKIDEVSHRIAEFTAKVKS